jgi:cell division transport system ATP-binding protein
MIKFHNVTKIYPPNTIALENVSFSIEKKEFVLITGRSGAGKTTLLKLIIAEEKPTKGKIFFEGKEINFSKPKDFPKIRRKIGVVFQDYKLFPSKNVFENLAYVMEVIGKSKEEILRDVPKVLEIVGLKEKAFNFPKELSSGEKQRVAIARALIHQPEVILADEPTGNLDPYHTSDILKLFLKIHQFGTTIILATHNKEIINRLGKRAITLEKGKIIRDEEKGKFVL